MAGFTRGALTHGAARLPGLRRLPVLKLVAVGEIALLATDHVRRLDPSERRRLLVLLRQARGRPSRLTQRERRELERLVHKLETRQLVGHAADRLSPVPLPRRIVEGRRRPR